MRRLRRQLADWARCLLHAFGLRADWLTDRIDIVFVSGFYGPDLRQEFRERYSEMLARTRREFANCMTTFSQFQDTEEAPVWDGPVEDKWGTKP